MSKEKMDLVEQFHKTIEVVANENDIFPHHCLWIEKNDTNCHAMLATPDAFTAYVYVVKSLIGDRGVKEIVFGFDRVSKGAAQGNEFTKLITLLHYKENKWRFGVIEYEVVGKKKTVKPIDWGNEYWREVMMSELKLAQLQAPHTNNLGAQELIAENAEDLQKKYHEFMDSRDKGSGMDAETTGLWTEMSRVLHQGLTDGPNQELRELFQEVDKAMAAKRPSCIRLLRLTDVYRNISDWTPEEREHIKSGCVWCAVLKGSLDWNRSSSDGDSESKRRIAPPSVN